MITYVFRKRTPTGFSIEKIFDGLYLYLSEQSTPLTRVELPYVSTGMLSVFRNILYVRCRAPTQIIHITGDVHYAALLRPFSKVIITVHDCVAMRRGKGFKKFVFWLLWFRLPLALANMVTVISQRTKEELLSVVNVPEDKLVVIPNYVSSKLKFSAPSFNSVKPRILHIGTGSNKNLPRVIASLQGMNCLLVIVGVLDAVTRNHLETCGIEFENEVSINDERLADLYRQADIISFPSTYEGFGMPIIEGQAVGRPVLTSNLEPMISVAGEGGALFVDPLSEESIRNGFKQLIEDASLRERIVATGLENCKAYSIASVASRYQTLYRNLHE